MTTTLPHNAAVLYDMHCHLDFVENADEFHQLAAVCGVSSLSNTVTPQNYRDHASLFSSTPYARLALGAHPWWIANGDIAEDSLALFEQLASTTRFIGEVGLDFSGERAKTANIQLATFKRILTACKENKLISLHANGAESELLDALENAKATTHNNCILHWYAGPADQLQRAVKLGCYFSVGKRMLKTKRGREYARIIPLELLLLESDMPSKENTHYTPAQWNADLTEALLTVAELRKSSPDHILNSISASSMRLLNP